VKHFQKKIGRKFTSCPTEMEQRLGVWFLSCDDRQQMHYFSPMRCVLIVIFNNIDVSYLLHRRIQMDFYLRDPHQSF